MRDTGCTEKRWLRELPMSYPVQCIAPWSALCIKADGSVVPDIHYKKSLGNIHQQSLVEILENPLLLELRKRMKAFQFDAGCRNCELKEKSGGRSRRTFFYDVLYEQIQNRSFDISESPSISFLELNTSNVCNLKCRMCSGLISSSWARDELALQETSIASSRPRFGVFSLGKEGIDRLFEKPEVFRDLKVLALRGGEPLYEEQNIYLFEKLEDLGLSSQIHLDISTNGTIISDKVMKALSRFNSIELYLSVEGVGPAYQYIRGGKHFQIKDIEKSVRRFQEIEQINLVFTYTSMIYNIGELNGFWQWYNDIRKNGDEVSLSNIVVNPEYLNFQLLPEDLKQKYYEEIDQGPIPKGEYDTGKRELRDVGIQAILEGLQNTSYFSVEKTLELRRAFKVFNDQIDKKRNMPIQNYIPEIARFSESIC